jgi:large subunit ribosomal protein L3
MGLVGRKCGMTRVFTEDGDSIPVTVIEAQPNRITQVKTVESDGYRALQVSAGRRKASRVSKPQAGHFAQAKVEAGDLITEFRLDDADQGDFEMGHEIKVDLFEAGQKVDVIGTSIGKGYAGTVKRHNFRTQDATHGNSLAHRAPGSIGQNQTPGRVFKGKKMSGHMGNVRSTVQNLEVVRVDAERNLLLIKGAVPGHRGGRVIVRRRSRYGEPEDEAEDAGQRVHRCRRERIRRSIQRGAGPPGRYRVSRGGAGRHQGTEEPIGGTRRRHQAVAPEGHRPRACRHDPQPDLGRWWPRIRGTAAQP